MSASNKGPGVDSRLQNLTNALYVDSNNDIVVRTGFAGNIVISGNVNVPGVINVQSSPEDPVDIHIRQVGTSGILNVPWLPVSGNVRLDSGTNSIGNVRITDGSITVTNFPAFPSNVSITSLPGITVTNFPSNVRITDLPGITGNVNVTFPSIYKVSKNTSDNTASNAIAVEISTGNGLVVSGTNALPTRVLNDESLIAYARGAAVTEAEVLNAYLIDKSGATSTLGTTPATMTTVWSYTGLFPWTTFAGSGDKLYIKSLTDDPKVRNKSIKIEGLDSNYNILIEEVAFGTNTSVAVSTTNNFYRINRIYLTGNNTNNLPQTYDIEVRYGSTSGTIVSYLIAPWARGQNCFYTVPAGYEAFLLSLNGNSGKDDEITSSLWVRTFNGTWELKKSFKFISGLFDHNFRTPLRIPEKSDVEIRAFALVESSSIGTEFQLLVLPKA